MKPTEDLRKVVEELGGVANLRLTRCPDFKLISYIHQSGQWIDLVVEDDSFYDRLVRYLEELGVDEIPWK